MEVNSSIYKTNIDKDLEMLNLIDKAKKSMYHYFEETLKDPVYSLSEDFSLDLLDTNAELVSYGVRFDLWAGGLFEFCVIFKIHSTENRFLYNYYAYFDSKGNLVDDFVN